MHVTKQRVLIFCFAMLMAPLEIGARADVLKLKNGGQIEGRLIKDRDEASSSYVIATRSGAQITVPRSKVARIVKKTELDEKYQELAHGAKDTAELHWKLAEWCRERKLKKQSRQHLARLLELDPEHAQARQRLGYQKIGNAWMTRDDIMTARGLVMFNGKYQTRQHAELLERAEKNRQAKADWSDRLSRLRRRMNDRRPELAQQARDEILAIRDPRAAKMLVQLLDREENREVRLMLLEVIAKIDHQLTVNRLVKLSFYDPDEEIRYLSLEHLIRSGRPGIVAPYIQALKSRDNRLVNLAAFALQTIGDASVISPLIDALITEHKYQVSSGSGGEQSFSQTSDGGFSFGGGGPKFTKQSLRNPSVLSALVVLSGGASFGYDQEQWQRWLAAQAKLHPVDVRRDL